MMAKTNACYGLEVFNKPRNFDVTARISEATHLYVVSAFATVDGLRQLIPRTREMDVTGLVVVGGSQFFTPPDVLRVLLTISSRNPALKTFLCFPPKRQMFHPKVYVLTLPGGRQFALVGSANMTGAAFKKNTEAMLFNDEKSDLKRMRVWAEEITGGGWCKEINSRVIEDYEKKYMEVKRSRDKTDHVAELAGTDIESLFDYWVEDWADLVAGFRAHMAGANRVDLATRKRTVKKLPGMLNAPTFKVRYEGLKAFYKTGELGEMREAHTQDLARNAKALSRTLRFLSDESIPISVRYEQSVARTGEFHLPGIGRNFASKFLASLHPTKYPALNKRVEDAMGNYGSGFRRGLPLGRKYELFADQMKLLIREVRGADMVDLDHYFYWLSREL